MESILIFAAVISVLVACAVEGFRDGLAFAKDKDFLVDEGQRDFL